jgi:hypothetical protein
MRSAFRNVADNSRTERHALPGETQPASTLNDVADDVFISVFDLFWIGIFIPAKCDQASGELLFTEAIGVADLVVQFLETLECLANCYNFHQLFAVHITASGGMRCSRTGDHIGSPLQTPVGYDSVTAVRIAAMADSALSLGTLLEPTTL